MHTHHHKHACTHVQTHERKLVQIYSTECLDPEEASLKKKKSHYVVPFKEGTEE